jgi:hypothetical protein
VHGVPPTFVGPPRAIKGSFLKEREEGSLQVAGAKVTGFGVVNKRTYTAKK